MAKKRGLGRSLDALLGGATAQNEKTSRPVEPESLEAANTPATDTPSKPGPPSSSKTKHSSDQAKVSVKSKLATASAVAAGIVDGPESLSSAEIEIDGDKLRQLPVDRIRRGSYQPRKQFDRDALQELADSLKEQGMIQPILVRPFADGYELVAGERRWRAAQIAGMQEIPAIVRELDDQSVAAVSLIENIQRKDLNPLEEAMALQRLQSEFGMTHQEVATAVGRSRTAVTNLMRLLDLHEEVKVMLDKGELDMGHARALLAIEPNRQRELAREIVAKGLSVRAAERLVKAEKEPAETSRPAKRDSDIVALEKSLGLTLAAAVSIKHQTSGKGKLEINYNNLDELEGILSHIK